MSDILNPWKPPTNEETELAKLCQEFCKVCDTETVERHGKGKLHNIPFNYFIYWDILGNPQDSRAYTSNRKAFDRHLEYIKKHKGDLEKEIKKAKEEVL